MLPQETGGREQNEEMVKARSIWEIPHEDEVPLFRALKPLWNQSQPDKTGLWTQHHVKKTRVGRWQGREQHAVENRGIAHQLN